MNNSLTIQSHYTPKNLLLNVAKKIPQEDLGVAEVMTNFEKWQLR